jgi:hypothetical protein
MSDISSKYNTLAVNLKNLENFIFAHAAIKQDITVNSFLIIALNKAKLEGEITLIVNSNETLIKAKKINLIICAQNEIANIPFVEDLYKVLTKNNFKYFNILKYNEYLPSNDKDTIENLSTTIDKVELKVENMKFHVAKFGSDKYGRTIKIAVYINDITDSMLTQSECGNFWIPNDNLFYLLDLIFGEYYMTKHISNINFFPINILQNDKDLMTATKAKSAINVLLRLNHKKCEKCSAPEYRANINENNICNNCA